MTVAPVVGRKVEAALWDLMDAEHAKNIDVRFFGAQLVFLARVGGEAHIRANYPNLERETVDRYLSFAKTCSAEEVEHLVRTVPRPPLRARRNGTFAAEDIAKHAKLLERAIRFRRAVQANALRGELCEALGLGPRTPPSFVMVAAAIYVSRTYGYRRASQAFQGLFRLDEADLGSVLPCRPSRRQIRARRRGQRTRSRARRRGPPREDSEPSDHLRAVLGGVA